MPQIALVLGLVLTFMLGGPEPARATILPDDDAVPVTGLTPQHPPPTPSGEPRASLAAMRAYRISLLTDEEIRERRRLAEAEFARLQAEAAARHREYMANYESECRKVNTDVVYRARNPNACKGLSPPKTYSSKTVGNYPVD